MLLDLLFELVGVQNFILTFEGLDLFKTKQLALNQSLIRGLGFVIFFDIPALDPLFGLQLHRWTKKIVILFPDNIEVVDDINQIRVFESIIPQTLTNMGPVLLFYMGIIIFMVAP